MRRSTPRPSTFISHAPGHADGDDQQHGGQHADGAGHLHHHVQLDDGGDDEDQEQQEHRTSLPGHPRTGPGRPRERDDVCPEGRASWHSRRAHPPGVGAARRVLARPLGHEVLALDLVQAAPDAVRLTDAEGVVEAVLLAPRRSCRSPWPVPHARASRPCARRRAAGRTPRPVGHGTPPSPARNRHSAEHSTSLPLSEADPTTAHFPPTRGELLLAICEISRSSAGQQQVLRSAAGPGLRRHRPPDGVARSR